MVFTVTRRGQAYCLIGGKKSFWNEGSSQHQHNPLGAEDHGQECIKQYDLKTQNIDSTYLMITDNN